MEKNLKRIVVKVGSRVVSDENGDLARERLTQLIAQLSPYLVDGLELIWVTSGAVAQGRKKLNKPADLNLVERQAAASIGQISLINAYQEIFEHFKREPAQILLTADDFLQRKKYSAVKNTFETLLEWKCVPVVNENDVVSTMELEEQGKGKSFGDNDKLSAILASRLDADLLINLTNVDGVFTDNPHRNPEAKFVPFIENVDQINSIRREGLSKEGRGGLMTKLEAARTCCLSGVPMIITSGFKPEVLKKIMEDPLSPSPDRIGTLIIPQGRKLPERKQWIGIASGFVGVLRVNMGASMALLENRASLLAAGILEIDGDFQKGQIVSIQNNDGAEIGRGVSNFSSSDLELIKGKRSEEMAGVVGKGSPAEVIHRDRLVIFQEYEK